MADDENLFLKTLNFFSPANWWEAVVGAATGDNEDLQGVKDPSFQQRLGSVAANSQLLSGTATGFEKATNAPVIGAPLKFVLDFGFRTTDSFFGGFQMNDARNDASLGTWAEGWRKSWDSWGTDQHVSAGDLVGAQLNQTFGGNTGTDLADLDPTNPGGVSAIQAMARRDWYGNILGGVTDLVAGSISPVTPASAAIKAGRSMRDLSHLGRVEAASDVFNAASKAGKLDDLSLQRGRSFFRELNGADSSGEAYAARLRNFAREAMDHASDNSSAMNFFGPRMENATEASKRIMATTAVLARQLGPEMGTHVVGNAWLWVSGSAKSGKIVKESAPLVFDAIRTATAPPEMLGITAKAQSELLTAMRTGGDIRLDKIMETAFETPAKKAQHAAILDALGKAKVDAEQAATFRGRVMSMKPQFRQKVDGKYVDSFDTARLKETRLNAENQYRTVAEELKQAKADLARRNGEAKGLAQMSAEQQKGLTSKQALQDGADALKSKEGRDALAAFGPYKDAEYYAKEAGAGTARVTATKEKIAELEQRLAQAKADRDLLASTPLNDPDAMAAWRSELSAARAGAKDAVTRRDMLAAMERIQRQQLKDDLAAARRVAPTLNASNTWLKDIWELGDIEPARLNVSSSLLERMKTKYRDSVGESFIFETGEYSPKAIFHRHPKEQMASIGTAYGRSAVNTHDVYKGQQELGMFLRKSGVFTGDEIRAAVNEFIATAPNKIAQVVEKFNDEMLRRMFDQKGVDPLTAKHYIQMNGQVKNQTRSYLTGRLKEADDTGQKWVRTNEFPGEDASDAMHMIDAAFLRSHLSDTVPFMDPAQARKLVDIAAHDVSRFDKAGAFIGGGTDIFNHIWKTYNLVRPGLFFRNMLDTGIRATLLMGAAGTLYSTSAGSRNFIRNHRVRVGDWSLRHKPTGGTPLQRYGARLGPEELTKQVLGDKGVTVAIGNGKTATRHFYEMEDGHASAASVAGLRSAMTRGAPLHEGLLGSQTPLHDYLVRNMAKWDKYKAGDPRWVEAYRDHAQALLASPTAKKMIEQDTIHGPVPGIGDRVKDLFSDPKVRDEYNKLSSELGMTREQFIEQLDWEMSNMFPEPGMAADVLSGKLKGKRGDRWIEEHFPVELRFDVPGYESMLDHPGAPGARAIQMYKNVTDKVFNVLMDEPDFWLIRHPVAVNAHAKQLRLEAKKLLETRRAKYGDNVELTADDIAKMDSRARTYAVSTVKKYMYDSAYSTEFSQAVHRIAPFFIPWEDAMRSYSKLIYDNPQRLQLMAGAWGAPDRLSPWLDQPLVVDINGNEVKPGEVPKEGGGERFYVLSSLLPGKGRNNTKTDAATGRRRADGNLKLRQSSFNTILMGNTPWLPGWGPTTTVPMGVFLNSQEDVALWLSSSDNPVIKTLMESLWPGGEVPRNDQIWESLKPPWFRKVQDLVYGGEGFWRNVQYGMNQRYLNAMRNGEPYDPARWQKEAEIEATNAGILAGISQFVFGLSAKSDVSGQFYVDEMRSIQTIPIEQVRAWGFPTHQAMFAAKHPEAANLTWTFTRNETGINATVQAQDRAMEMRPLIEKTPDLGWFILGDANVGGDFSQTAYNQQRSSPYGFEQASRKRLDPGEQIKNTVTGQGWDQYIAFSSRANALAAQYGFTPQVLSQVKSAFAQQLGAQNPQWFEDYGKREQKLQDFFNKADLIVQDPKLRDRQDIGMFVEYKAIRQQVLDLMGLKSLNGTGEKSARARAVLNEIGARLAAQDIGFQQIWERMLSGEVDAMPTDARFGVTDGVSG